MTCARRRQRAAIGVLLAITGAVCGSVSSGPAAGTPRTTSATHESGDGDTILNLRSGVAIAPDDVWLVGTDYPSQRHTIARHWDGSTWRAVATVDPGTVTNGLSDIDASASDDVWAVGSYHSDGDQMSLVEHWDGTAWTVVPVPDQPGNEALVGVSVIDANDVWAAGTTFSPLKSFLLHWDGVAWSMQGIRGGQYLDLSATSDTNVWTNYEHHPSRWDGSGWTDKYFPTSTFAVAAIGPVDVWAAGNVGYHPVRLSFLHFDGSSWTQTPVNAPGRRNGIIYLSAVASNNVWAVAQGIKHKSDIGQVFHWDGTSWSPLLHRTHFGGVLIGVVATAPDDAWAFGWPHGIDSPANVMHWDGGHWKVFAVA